MTPAGEGELIAAARAGDAAAFSRLVDIQIGRAHV